MSGVNTSFQNAFQVHAHGFKFYQLFSSSPDFRLRNILVSSMHTFHIIFNKLNVFDTFVHNFIMFLARGFSTFYYIHCAGPRNLYICPNPTRS